MYGDKRVEIELNGESKLQSEVGALGAVGDSLSPLFSSKSHSIFELSFIASPGGFGVQLADPGPRFGCETLEEEPAKFVGDATTGGGCGLTTMGDSEFNDAVDLLPKVPCATACEDEFALCADHGPGYTVCVQEIRRKLFRLGNVCRRDCDLTDKMKAHYHGKCRHGCEKEFNLCVVEGPGYDRCIEELQLALPHSPLTEKCDANCELTDMMKSYDLSVQQTNCSSACMTEFYRCKAEGAGVVTCIFELRKGTGPLSAVCEPKCKISEAMMNLAAPSPPPFPPAHECIRSCEVEFHECVKYNPGGCDACDAEMVALPFGSPLTEKGCTSNCHYSPQMREWCPSHAVGRPPPPPSPPPSPPSPPPQIYAFSSFSFTTGKSSYSDQGASASDFNSAMSGVTWASNGDYYRAAFPFAGYQMWLVPKAANYRIKAAGGEGGGQGSCKGNGGIPGALIQGDFKLDRGDILVIAVGSGGGNGVGDPHNGNERGGGGGSFVAKWGTSSFDSGDISSATPLIIAGGGGGRPGPNYGCNCVSEQCGFGQGAPDGASVCQTYSCSSSATSSISEGGKTAGSHQGGAGGGWNGNGADGLAHCGGCTGGAGWQNGLEGGQGNTCYISDNKGGFGGGGGGCLGGPGGGGGYTGGNAVASWSGSSGPGGGGGSYNTGENQVNTAGGGPRASSSMGGANGYVDIQVV